MGAVRNTRASAKDGAGSIRGFSNARICTPCRKLRLWRRWLPRPLWLVVLAAGLIVGIAMGIRQVMGLYLPP